MVPEALERIPPTRQCSNDPLLPWSLQDIKQEEEERLILESNPLEWTVTDVVRFIKLTDCAPLAKIFQEQVRRFCGIFAAFIMRLWVSVKRSVLAGFPRHSFARGGGASS